MRRSNDRSGGIYFSGSSYFFRNSATTGSHFGNLRGFVSVKNSPKHESHHEKRPRECPNCQKREESVDLKKDL